MGLLPLNNSGASGEQKELKEQLVYLSILKNGVEEKCIWEKCMKFRLLLKAIKVTEKPRYLKILLQ